MFKSNRKGLLSVKSRRQALKLCLDAVVVVVIEIFNKFLFEVIHEEAETAKMRAVTEAKTASERVCNFISADITGFDDIPRFQKELNDAYDAAKT